MRVFMLWVPLQLGSLTCCLCLPTWEPQSLFRTKSGPVQTWVYNQFHWLSFRKVVVGETQAVDSNKEKIWSETIQIWFWRERQSSQRLLKAQLGDP